MLVEERDQCLHGSVLLSNPVLDNLRPVREHETEDAEGRAARTWKVYGEPERRKPGDREGANLKSPPRRHGRGAVLPNWDFLRAHFACRACSDARDPLGCCKGGGVWGSSYKKQVARPVARLSAPPFRLGCTPPLLVDSAFLPIPSTKPTTTTISSPF